jgi:hypothetical protein
MMHKIDWECSTITAACFSGVIFAIFWPETAQVSCVLWSIATWSWFMAARRIKRERNILLAAESKRLRDRQELAATISRIVSRSAGTRPAGGLTDSSSGDTDAEVKA